MNKYRHISNPRPTENDLCIVCGYPFAETHEVFFGNAYLRNKSIEYGCQEKLCVFHHREGKNAVHNNRQFDLELKRKHQARLLEDMTEIEFIKIFGKLY